LLWLLPFGSAALFKPPGFLVDRSADGNTRFISTYIHHRERHRRTNVARMSGFDVRRQQFFMRPPRDVRHPRSI